MFYFATESGDHVIKILICDWSMFNVVVFVRWSCKFCLYFWLLQLFNLFSLFSMRWTDSQIESLTTFYSSVLVSSARNFATGVKNRRQKPTPVFWRRFLAPVSGACVISIRIGFNPTRSTSPCYKPTQYTCMLYVHKNESKHSEMDPVRQNPIQRTVRSVYMCVHCTVHNCCTQYCTEQTW